MRRRFGVCSWSLLPTGPGDLVEKVLATGVKSVQLALDPIRLGLWDERETVEKLAAEKITIASAMIAMKGEDYASLESIRKTGGVRPTLHWEENLAAAWENSKLAHRLGVPLVTFHAGFFPEDGSDRERRVMIERVRAVSDRFAAEGIEIGLETGQETAATMLSVLRELDRPRIGVNFDPANMILYGMGDPVKALEMLAGYVRQIHVKDARPATEPGAWGTEVRAGKGAVDWKAFFEKARACDIDCDLVIERETGDDRVADVRAAVTFLDRLLQPARTTRADASTEGR